MIEHTEYRRLMGFWATGVSVVTAQGADGPYGATLNAFSSLSLDPQLLLVCFDHSARTLGALRHSGRFCVNILSAEQEEISRRFVGKRPMAEKFAELAWGEAHGAPVLQDCLAVVVCDLVQEFEGGDHTIVIGAPLHMATRDDLHPLVFYRGGYWERIAELAERGVRPEGEYRLTGGGAAGGGSAAPRPPAA